MNTGNSLGSVAPAIRATAAALEARFLQAGAALEAAVGILSRLTSGFETVEDALRGSALAGAHAQLSQAAGVVAAMAGPDQAQDGGFAPLLRHGVASAASVARLDTLLAAMKVLAVNARIAAAGINVPGTDFMTFAADIARTVATTQANLEAFASGLAAVRARLAAARSGQERFSARKAEAARSVPARLVATAELIARQHAKAAQANAVARERSARVRTQICSAIVSLQVGDATRQRLEHVDTALGLLGTRPADAVAGPVLRLQAAQLVDAADEFEREAQAITLSLQGLAGDLRALHQLGESAHGGAGRGGSPFIVELEGQIAAARTLLVEFGAAHDEAESVRAAVVQATTELSAHLRSVQSCETDLRIMGLNTTFKCARAGRDGLMLSCIAQELRSRSNEFARESAVLMNEVTAIARIGGAMSAAGHDDSALALAAEALDAAFSTLSGVEALTGEAAARLHADSVQAMAVMDQAVAGLEGGGIARSLGDAATALGVPPAASPDDTQSAVLARMLEEIERSYTMVGERRVHARIFGQASMAASAPTPEAALELEDMLF